MMRWGNPRRVRTSAATAAVLTAWAISSLLGSSSAGPLDLVWSNVQAAGAYSFSTDIEQVSRPTSSIADAGRVPTSESIHLEGRTDRRRASTEIDIWSGSGATSEEASSSTAPSLSIRVADGVVATRQLGGTWSDAPADAQLLTTAGDLVAALAAARDIESLGSRSTDRWGTLQGYSFTLDGEALATALADGLGSSPSVAASLADYRAMTGAGEVWIDSRGLPAEQVLSLVSPNADGSSSTSSVSVVFDGFGAIASASVLETFASALDESLPFIGLALAVWLLLLVGATPLPSGDESHRPRRGRLVVAALVAFALMAGDVGTAPSTASARVPLVGTPESRVSSRAAALPNVASRESAAALRADAMSAALAAGHRRASQADPHAGLLLPQEASALDLGVDTDGDGLSDTIEARIGTDASEPDSDGDSLSDRVEVLGFTLASVPGLEWYTDPLSADSNGDLRDDGTEWGPDTSGPAIDSDGDGVPNVFDDDDDADGVNDGIDLSPIGALRTEFDESNPFEVEIDGLSADGTPAFVDFQVRPTEQDRLDLGLQPLDWPADREGQVRDVNGSTGDMQLVPMLEIVLPDPAHVLPPTDELAPYSVSVKSGAGAAGERVAYVPLSAMTDELTGQRIGFSGRMRYRSQANWGAAHQVRVVWAVQVKNDIAVSSCPPAGEPQPDGCATTPRYVNDQPQIIHRYYDSWTLTGLRVTEERGTEMGVLSVDPDIDGPAYQDNMWILPEILNERFLSSTVAGDLPELDVSDLESAFDRESNVGSEVVYGGAPNVFRVESASYESFDEALHETSVAVIPGVLAADYSSSAAAADEVHPLLMTVYESNVRTADLAEIVLVDPANGPDVTLDLAPGSSPTTDRIAGFKWSSYCNTAGATPSWTLCSSEEVWAGLEEKYGDVIFDPNDPMNGVVVSTDEDVRDGEMLSMQLYWSTVSSGIAAPIQRQGAVTSEVLTPLSVTNASDLNSQVRQYRAAVGGVRGVSKLVANYRMLKSIKATLNKINSEVEGDSPLAKLGALLNKPGVLEKGGIVRRYSKLALAAALATSALLIADLLTAPEADGKPSEVRLTIKWLAVFVTVGLELVRPIQALRTVSSVASRAQLRSLGLTVTAQARNASLIGAVIAGVLTWAFAIGAIIASGAAFYSPEAFGAIAGALGATAYIVLTTALAFTGIGLVLVGIVAVLDALLQAVCESGDSDPKENSLRDNETGTCFTVSGAIIEAMTRFIYAYEVMIEVDDEAKAKAGRPPLVVTESPDIYLLDDSAGWAVGNSWGARMNVVSNVSHQSPSPWSWQVIPYLWFFSEGNLRSSSMAYTLTSPNAVSLSTSWDDMPGAWSEPSAYDEYLEKDLYRATKTNEVTLAPVRLTTAGLNQSFSLHLNMAYAFPAYECWTVPMPITWLPLIPICYKRESDGDAPNSFDPMTFDVLPETLSEFLQLRDVGNGRSALAWDPAFTPLDDADGDGLLAAASGGLDPDDRDSDVDDDGLSDRLELEWQQSGAAVSPRTWDTDLDGLTDAQERRIGTDPGVADTDNDGLSDGEEVRHLSMGRNTDGIVWDGTFDGGWTVTIPGRWDLAGPESEREIVVSSDPFSADGDKDGISDEAERQLAASVTPLDRDGEPYHPRVANASPVSVVLTTDDADGFVAPGQDVEVTTAATAWAAMQAGVANVTVDGDVWPDWVPGLLGFDESIFDTDQTVSDVRTWTVPDDRPSGPVEFVSDVVSFLSGSPTPAAWLQSNETALQGDARYGRVDVSPVGSNSSDFTVSDESSTSTASGGAGNVWSTPLTSGSRAQLEQDTEPVWPSRDDAAYRRGGAGTDVACLDDGTCLTVWDHYDNCSELVLHRLRVVRGRDEPVDGIEPLITIDPGGYDWSAVGGRLWYSGWTGNGGNNLQPPTTRGPDSYGFPVERQLCGDATLEVWESDDAPNISQLDWSYPTGPRATDPAVAAPTAGLPLSAELLVTPTDVDFANYEAQYSTGSECISYNIECQWVTVNVSVTPSTGMRVAGRLRSPDGATRTAQLPIGDGENPSVATDGSGFVAVWADTSDDPTYCSPAPCRVVRRAEIDANGSVSTSIVFANSAGATPLEPVVSWNGTDAIVTVSDPMSGLVWAVNGSTMDVTLVPTLTKLTAGVDAVDSASDVVSGETVVVAEQASTGNIVAHRLGIDALGDVVVLGSRTVLEATAQGGIWSQPSVVANPITGGWMVTALDDTGLHALSLDSDLSEFGWSASSRPAAVPGAGSTSFDSALSCPAAGAVPSLDLRFEELPGATELVDSSAQDNTATFAGGASPALAYPGAPDAPDSSFAARFDGAGESISAPNPAAGAVTVSFWYRSDGSASGSDPFVLSVGDDGVAHEGARVSIAATDGRPSFALATFGKTPATDVNDGDWHFLAAAFDPEAQEIRVTLDGASLAAAPLSVAPTASDAFTITGGSVPAYVDHVQVWTSALSNQRVAAIRDRTDLVHCTVVASVPGATAADPATYEWSRHTFTEADTRGGKITTAAQLRLTVDGDAPTSEIVAPTSAWTSGGLVIGGSALDQAPAEGAPSGIGLVEVSLDGGPWVDADGADAWTYVVPDGLSDGSHTLRSRAVDLVGNVESIPQEIEFGVDTLAPEVTLDDPGLDPIQPAVDPSTQRVSVSLSGDVTEGGSGIVDGGLRVRLVPSSGATSEGDWQPASVTGGRWSIDVEWPANSIPADVFQVEVAVVDGVGNSDSAVIGSLTVDAQAPGVSLARADAARDFMARGATLSGRANDLVSDIASVEVAFRPIADVIANPPVAATWRSAELVGAGHSLAWTIDAPVGVEEIMQVDLRATDAAGNSVVVESAWRGIIDTVAPRIIFTGDPTGRRAARRTLHEVAYRCSATDAFLSVEAFECPGEARSAPIQTFTSDPTVLELFPGEPQLIGLDLEYVKWELASLGASTVSACDIFGNCSQRSLDALPSTSLIQTEAVAPPVAAAVLDPFDGQFVRASDVASVLVDAAATEGLRRVTVLLDGAPIAEWGFARADAPTTFTETASLATAGGDDDHVVTVVALSWSGDEVESEPVSFFYDSTPPALTHDIDELTLADTWGPGTEVFVLSGGVADVGGISSVEVEIGDSGWVDVPFDPTSWRGALRVPGVDGSTVSIRVRAFDRAGNVTELVIRRRVDLAGDVAGGYERPETSVRSVRAVSGVFGSVAVALVGTAGDNAVATFRCSLDGGPEEVCDSPLVLTGLSAGRHSLSVVAIDEEGFADLTPAIREWDVAAAGPQVTILRAPSASTTSTSATFEFSGPSGARAACSVDGGSFRRCSSPYTVTDLALGEHSIRIRMTLDGVVGTPAERTWTVVQPDLVAKSVVVSARGDDRVGEAFRLSGSGGSSLAYRVITQPLHGELIGTGASLRYRPFVGFRGADSFTYVVDDGMRVSEPATVNITVTMPGVAVFAEESVRMRDDSIVHSGDVVVRRAGATTLLEPGYEVWFGAWVKFLDPLSRVVGDSVRVGGGSVIPTLLANELRDGGAEIGTWQESVVLPYSDFPAAPRMSGPRGRDVVLGELGDQLLAPGRYGALVLGDLSTLRLSGGLYEFTSIVMGMGSTVTTDAAVELRVSGRITMGSGAYVRPSGSVMGAGAADIIVTVLGGDDSQMSATAGAAFEVGYGSIVHGDVVVPNGTIRFGNSSIAVGSLSGRDVDLGYGFEMNPWSYWYLPSVS